ncbi:MAG: hypothetical protein CM15mP39_04560 [Synechococcus sp.]|nr:MAG: hypothetical protein CM15mP39_04560 [Synechococcus sp.]
MVLPEEQGLVEVVIDDGLLSGCVNRAGRTGFGSPAELSITIVLLLEPPVDVTEVAQVLEGAGGRRLSMTCSKVRPPLRLVPADASSDETLRCLYLDRFF